MPLIVHIFPLILPDNSARVIILFHKQFSRVSMRLSKLSQVSQLTTNRFRGQFRSITSLGQDASQYSMLLFLVSSNLFISFSKELNVRSAGQRFVNLALWLYSSEFWNDYFLNISQLYSKHLVRALLSDILKSIASI